MTTIGTVWGEQLQGASSFSHQAHRTWKFSLCSMTFVQLLALRTLLTMSFARLALVASSDALGGCWLRFEVKIFVYENAHVEA